MQKLFCDNNNSYKKSDQMADPTTRMPGAFPNDMEEEQLDYAEERREDKINGLEIITEFGSWQQTDIQTEGEDYSSEEDDDMQEEYRALDIILTGGASRQLVERSYEDEGLCSSFLPTGSIVHSQSDILTAETTPDESMSEKLLEEITAFPGICSKGRSLENPAILKNEETLLMKGKLDDEYYVIAPIRGSRRKQDANIGELEKKGSLVGPYLGFLTMTDEVKEMREEVGELEVMMNEMRKKWEKYNR